MTNQLQTVLDALEQYAEYDPTYPPLTKPTNAAAEAIEIVRQMMQAEPVAWVLFRRDNDGLEPVTFYGGKEKPEGEFKDRFELHSVHTTPAAPKGAV